MLDPQDIQPVLAAPVLVGAIGADWVWLVTAPSGETFQATTEQVRAYVGPRIRFEQRDPRPSGTTAALPGVIGQEARHLKERGAYDVYEFDGAEWVLRQRVGASLATDGGTTPNAAPTASLSISASALFVGQSFTLVGTAADPDGSIATFDIYEGGQLLQRFTQQPYLLSLTPTSAGEKTYIGVATDNLGLSRQSAPQTVRVLTTANQLPVASLSTSVERGVVGQAMTITVLASDPDGYITGVGIYNGPKLLGTVSSAPYSITYTPGAVGTLQLIAIATDDKGGQRTTEPKLLPVVAGAQNSVPTISLQAPSTATTGTTLALIASAMDTDGTVTKVEYYDASNKLGETTSLPHTFAYTPQNPGSYFFRAIATDNDGNKGESGTIPCVVSAVAIVNFTPPAPTFSGFSDTQEGGSVTLVLSADISLSEHRVSLPGSTAFNPATTTTIEVGNIAGTVRAYTVSAKGRNQSPTGTSQAFTAYTAPPASFSSTRNYTARCGTDKPGLGADVTRSATRTSTVSQADAETAALSAAQADAISALICTIAPVNYSVTLDNVEQQTDGAFFAPESNQQLKFNGRTATGASGVTLNVEFVDTSNGTTSYLSLNDDYKGDPFSFVRANGTTFTGGIFPSTDASISC